MAPLFTSPCYQKLLLLIFLDQLMLILIFEIFFFFKETLNEKVADDQLCENCAAIQSCFVHM